MSISDAVALTRLDIVTGFRAAGGAEAFSLRRCRLGRMRSEQRTLATPRSFEHLKRSYD